MVVSSYACTIGAASGIATDDGRPMIWKTRDRSGREDNFIVLDDTGDYRCVYVTDAGMPDAWMGLNETGFCIMNSTSNDLTGLRIWGEGDLMYEALKVCATVDDFQNFLNDSVGKRSVAANFGVMDAQGGAAIFETSSEHFWRYDAESSENGYVLRTNHSEQGGSTYGRTRLIRSHKLIEDMYDSNSLNYKNILQVQMRDFMDDDQNGLPIPFEGISEPGVPYGFVDIYGSICGRVTVSTAVFQGVKDGEDPMLTTMWTMLGHPSSTIAVPIWAVNPPDKVTGFGLSPICTKAREIKPLIFRDDSNSTTHIDTYLLRNESGTGLWDVFFSAEDSIFAKTDSIRSYWADNGFTTQDLYDFSCNMTEYAYGVMDSVEIDRTAIVDFEADKILGEAPLTVNFTDKTQHNPINIYWDFDNNGMYDAYISNPTWTFTQPGTYSVRLLVENVEGITSYTSENMITVTESETSSLYLNPNPFFKDVVFSLYLSEPSYAYIKIYNIKGQKVYEYKVENSSEKEIYHLWSGANSENNQVASGIYLYKIETISKVFTGKLVRIK